MPTPEMSCDDAMVLHALDADGELGPDDAVALGHHLAQCRRCRETAELEAADDERVPLVWLVREGGFDSPPIFEPAAFRIHEEVGAGGMGKVYRAHDRRLRRDVALKELRPGENPDRFRREVLQTARLEHPAIVRILEAGRWPDGTPFYTMPIGPKRTLADAIAEMRTYEERAALLPNILTVADALTHAHARNVLHRDIKPANVLVGEDGETLVIDWGLANRDDSSEDPDPRDGATRAGVGTASYAAPEQIAGEEPSERADVYSLGATLYHLVAGQAPYADVEHPREVKPNRAPRAVRSIVPEVPRPLQSIVARAMATDPALRFPDVKSFAEQLRRFAAGLKVDESAPHILLDSAAAVRSRAVVDRSEVRHLTRTVTLTVTAKVRKRTLCSSCGNAYDYSYRARATESSSGEPDRGAAVAQCVADAVHGIGWAPCPDCGDITRSMRTARRRRIFVGAAAIIVFAACLGVLGVLADGRGSARHPLSFLGIGRQPVVTPPGNPVAVPPTANQPLPTAALTRCAEALEVAWTDEVGITREAAVHDRLKASFTHGLDSDTCRLAMGSAVGSHAEEQLAFMQAARPCADELVTRANVEDAGASGNVLWTMQEALLTAKRSGNCSVDSP